MLPIDLRALQDLASRAIGCLANALGDAAEDSQRGYLLEAMSALDDIEATLETAFELSMELPNSERGAPALRIVGGEAEAESTSLVA